MTQFDNADIKAVSTAVRNAMKSLTVTHCHEHDDPSTFVATAAIIALEERGWGKKPTRSELWDIGGWDADNQRWPIDHDGITALINAGFAVDDPEPEWEPTEDAVKAIRSVWDKREGTTFNDIFAAVLKHIRANPHLIGMGEKE